MKTVLVTSGARFIESHLAVDLLAHAAAVRVLDNFSTGRRKNLAEIRDDVEVVVGDLRDAAAVQRTVAGAEGLFSSRGQISGPRSMADPCGT
jgi:UDP-glucose 4-epimerase